ncbi:MAG: hypothetical protein JNK15_03240, partial [Planctomycetes bacterium]|nr:hypothetical protein [Planctomycetota bacterium]
MGRVIDFDQRLADAAREAIATAVHRNDPGEFRYLNLRPIAEFAGIEQRDLVALSRVG